MDKENRIAPRTARGRWVKRIWGVLPALLLTVFMVMIVGMSVKIKGKAERLKGEKVAELHRERSAVNVIVYEVVPVTIQDKVSLPGVVEPWIRLQLLSEIRGRVVEVRVKEGNRVEKGDVIVRIDSRDYQIVLDSARASHTLAVANRERARKLFEKERIPKAELDNVETEAIVLESKMKDAELQLERCTITSPISGVVNRLDAKVGLLMNVSTPVAEILQVDRLKVAVGIPESDVSAVRSLSQVDLVVDALDGKVVSGGKYFLASSPDDVAHLYRLELEVDNSAGEILPGMFVRANVVKKEMPDSITIPLYAVISKNEDRLVYVEKEGNARACKVKLGILDGWRVQIVSGLKPGDRVIVVGHRDVNDGQGVKVVQSITDLEELVK